MSPNGSFRSARLAATEWTERFGSAKRTAAACGFMAEAIRVFVDRFSARTGIPVTPSALPEGIAAARLDSRTAAVAETIGSEAAALDPISAGYWLSITYTAMLPQAMRGTLGIFYTPPALSDRLIQMATEAGVDWASCRVLDPACGGGAFLAPTAQKMIEALKGRSPAEVVESISRRLRGFEIDPFAAWMSQVFLEVTMAEVCRAARRKLPRLVTVCDSLEQEPRDDAFDLVIGNPPYGRVTLNARLREHYRRSLYGHANLYGLFTDLALRWAAPGGVIAYVTPTSFLAGEYFKALRGLLAAEAPPIAVDFIATRKGVFENVQQETMLATYRRGRQAATATVHHLTVSTEGKASIEEAGAFAVPADPSGPWLIPRVPEHKPLIAGMARMKTRLVDWGYKISTGPLVWNRHKEQLRSRPSQSTMPLIWSEAIAGPGQFLFRAEKKNHEPYFKLLPGDEWLTIDKPCVLLQRTTAKEQSRRLIAAALPEELIAECGGVVVENHLNMVRPLNGRPGVTPAVVAAVLNSEIVDHAFRCISGSVAVSAFELEALPLPSVSEMSHLEALVKRNAKPETIERHLRALYLGEGA
ncbi:MAG: N-6 DNA methylase [Vicinamibacterales bacterium]